MQEIRPRVKKRRTPCLPPFYGPFCIDFTAAAVPPASPPRNCKALFDKPFPLAYIRRTRRERALATRFSQGRAAEGAHPETLRQKDRQRRKIHLDTVVASRFARQRSSVASNDFSHSGERQ
jgi:hypothetical protein